MYKLGVVGCFGYGFNLVNGQTIKSKILTDELMKKLGKNNVKTVDSYNWRERPFILLIRTIKLLFQCENIIVMPAHNGVKVFIPLLSKLNILFKRRLHYIVIGGWICEYISNNKKLLKYLKSFYGIYAETKSMVNNLTDIGLQTAVYLPNFKNLKILSEKELVFQNEYPYPLCTFSRISKEKGIEFAIDAISEINTQNNRTIFTLDIYGQVDSKYEAKFKTVISAFPDYIKYRGVVNSNDTVNIIKNYFMLLFPTFYEGEGFAGTLIDAFSCGVPVIASDWKYNSEIVINKINGYIFKTNDLDSFVDRLMFCFNNPKQVNEMKKSCINSAMEFSPSKVIIPLLENLK